MVSNDWLLPTDDVPVYLSRIQLQAIAAELAGLTLNYEKADARDAIRRICEAAALQVKV